MAVDQVCMFPINLFRDWEKVIIIKYKFNLNKEKDLLLVLKYLILIKRNNNVKKIIKIFINRIMKMNGKIKMNEK